MENVNLNGIRKADIIHLEGEDFEILEAWTANGIFQVKVNKNGKDIVLSYNILGDSLEDPSLNIKSVTFTELPEDKETVYYPSVSTKLCPYLFVNGQDMEVDTLMDLNGLEIKEPQVLKAEFKYVIIARLMKKLGREITVLKEEKIVCKSEDDCKEKLKEIEDHYKEKK